MPRAIAIALILALLSPVALGEPLPVPEPPEIPEPVESGVPLEPEVTIIRRERETIYEYRVNGQVYLIRVQPEVGPPYYFVDSDGDGNVDVRRTQLDRDSHIHQWLLFRW